MSQNSDTQSPNYAAFLGTWTLLPESCDYEQSEPPKESLYRISEELVDGQTHLRFLIDWTDVDNAHHQVQFTGPPNGQAQPFEGGELADSLSITQVSERELTSAAYYQGREIMVAQRQLDASGHGMRVVQLVRFLDGSTAINTGVYKKNPQA